MLSPHLDDAALSLGATIARTARSGGRVDVVNVFANDPDSAAGPGPWDAACGFPTAAEAAVRGRGGSARCQLLGAAVGCPFADFEYEQDVDDEALWAALADVVGAAETVLMPGFPLAAPDLLRLTRLLLARPLPGVRAGLYVEQPYATWLIGRGRRTGLRASRRQGLRNLFLITFRTRAGRRLQAPSDPTGALERVGALPGSRSGTGGSSSERFAPTGLRSRVSAARHLADGRLRGRMGQAIAWLPSS